MKKQELFPPEIIEFTVENYFVKQHRISSVIYIVVLLSVWTEIDNFYEMIFF